MIPDAEVLRICSRECRGRCCHDANVMLTVDTAELRRLQQRAGERGARLKFLNRPPADRLPGSRVEWRWVRPPTGCEFLTADQRCGIHPDRPAACRQFPHQRFAWCPLSHLMYANEALKED